jgi:uncharacterized protein
MRNAGFERLVAPLLLLWATLAHADPAPVMSAIPAHPALWVVHSQTATAYLLGSIHILPANIDWRTPEISADIAASDICVFEAPIDESGQAAGLEFIKSHAMLHDGVTLPSLLNRRTLGDYQKALSLTHASPQYLEHLQPWFAGVVLEVAFMEQQHYSADSGVDRKVFAIARSEGKIVRYFETVDQQLALLVPDNKKLELSEFDSELKELQTESDELGPMVDAWTHGNAAEVGRLVNADLEADPDARKVLLDDRNKAWVTQLRTMLSEQHTYFITVGAGHLAGPRGVPALLRKAGYRIVGP